MTHYGKRTCLLYGAGLILGLVMAGPVWSVDSPQSTGTGVMQGEDGAMSTKQGGNTGPTTGRNEHSGSATGVVRDPSEAEPSQDTNRRSSSPSEGSRKGADPKKGAKQSGALDK